MASGVTCRACGVALPVRSGPCPSCGAKLGRGRPPAWAGLAVAAALGLAAIVLAHRPRVDPALAGEVQVITGIKMLSADAKGTDITGWIENHGRVAVDVKVRVRCRDIHDRVHQEFEPKPYRNLAPGSSTPIQLTIDSTPIERVEIDLAELSATRP